VLIDLEARGLLERPGIQCIERAKANGSWERFDLAESLTLPKEMKDFFKLDQVFKQVWDDLTEAKRRQFLQQIYDAKTADTRTKRINTIRESICK
jgi:uncharacterized protein YdeI (YjbR/CyaY-like superfamily)